jgi:molybdate transport system substrate-binding protein
MKIRLALATAVATFLACAAQAAEIKILSGNGGKAAVAELSSRFERETGAKITMDVAVNPQVRKRILDGEAFDVAVLNPPVLDELIKAGKVDPATRSVIGRIGVGVGIKQGAPRPDLSTAEGFKKALLSAKKVAYPEEGASGIYFANLVKRLGIEDEMKSRLMPMPGEYNVEVVATGEAEMVVVVASRMWGVKGVDMAGLLPNELQTWIGFAAGVSTAAKDPDAARKLVKFLVAPSSEPFLRQMGMQPFVE